MHVVTTVTLGCACQIMKSLGAKNLP
jgi:hypothetical protein